MQVIINFQKNLSKVVYFNRFFSGAILLSLSVYLVQLSVNIDIITIALLLFGLIVLVFHVLLIEVIGQIIRKKTILTHDICHWLGKVISISMTVVVTINCLTTGNVYLASLYAVPIIICSFLGDTAVKNIGIFAIIYILILQHSGISDNKIFINNVVGYMPSSLIMAFTLTCVVMLAIIIVSNVKQTHQKTHILQSMATTDVLTGLINRRYFDRRINEEISRAKRHDSTLSLALFDVDHFKRINDTYGHTVGDKILKELGEVVLKNTRDCDISARYGGEEFALILPETTQIEAYELLERIRQLIENSTFCADETPVMVTVSVGIAQYDPEYDVKDFLDQADACLYQAKRTGRNKVVFGTFTTPKLNLQKKSNFVEFVK